MILIWPKKVAGSYCLSQTSWSENNHRAVVKGGPVSARIYQQLSMITEDIVFSLDHVFELYFVFFIEFLVLIADTNGIDVRPIYTSSIDMRIVDTSSIGMLVADIININANEFGNL